MLPLAALVRFYDFYSIVRAYSVLFSKKVSITYSGVLSTPKGGRGGPFFVGVTYLGAIQNSDATAKDAQEIPRYAKMHI